MWVCAHHCLSVGFSITFSDRIQNCWSSRYYLFHAVFVSINLGCTDLIIFLRFSLFYDHICHVKLPFLQLGCLWSLLVIHQVHLVHHVALAKVKSSFWELYSLCTLWSSTKLFLHELLVVLSLHLFLCIWAYTKGFIEDFVLMIFRIELVKKHIVIIFLHIAESSDLVRRNDKANVFKDTDCFSNILFKDHLLCINCPRLDPKWSRNFSAIRLYQCRFRYFMHFVEKFLARGIHHLICMLFLIARNVGMWRIFKTPALQLH